MNGLGWLASLALWRILLTSRWLHLCRLSVDRRSCIDNGGILGRVRAPPSPWLIWHCRERLVWYYPWRYRTITDSSGSVWAAPSEQASTWTATWQSRAAHGLYSLQPEITRTLLILNLKPLRLIRLGFLRLGALGCSWLEEIGARTPFSYFYWLASVHSCRRLAESGVTHLQCGNAKKSSRPARRESFLHTERERESCEVMWGVESSNTSNNTL